MKNFAIIIGMLLLAGCNQTSRQADAWGNFEARETIISAQATGILQSFDIEKGEFLEEGVTAGMIDTTQYALQFRLLMHKKQSVASRIADVNGNISILEAQQQNLEREIERTRRLVQDRAAPSQLLDDLEGKWQVMAKQIQVAHMSETGIHAELQALDAQLALAREQWDKCKIVNPLQGVVLERYAETHELVTQGKPLYKIADLSVMDLKVYVSGSQLPRIQLGQSITVFIDEDANNLQALEGKVNWISSRAEFTPKTLQTREERVNQVYAIRISVVNDGRIKIGMPGEAKF